ncbi:hypothetical protein ACQF36_35530 [Streptomyces sp. Marseille-Q5077]|uniref:hypothetical protein n=1 Tax=Streptomyces sp. Marseille-Q5077 TaxID=3418995 RepID=UPI003D0559D1
MGGSNGDGDNGGGGRDDEGGDNGGGGGHIEGPGWLPPGPHSPNTENAPDPESVYDVLRTPARCKDALDSISRQELDTDWQVLRGLANACLAIEGRGGSWRQAAQDYSAVANRVNTCKSRAAHRVLAGLLDFHRLYPSSTVELAGAPGGTRACEYVISSVDVGGDGEATPGDTIWIEVRGTYFDHSELLRDGSVHIGGVRLEGPPNQLSESGDQLVLAAVVPALGGKYGQAVDVRVHYNTTDAIKEAAFTVMDPGTPGGATGSASASP